MAETEMLPVRLTKDERLERASELTEKLDELRTLEAKRKDEAKAMKEACDRLDAEVARLTRIVRDGEENRPVDVKEVPHPSARTVETVRLDTGAVVRARAMTPSELLEAEQARLPFGKVESDAPDRKTQASGS